ncbi:MAG: hypothetical protein K5770_11495 [Lachnospiraceae bacterium]|nr:hypothetical protein [Lachnospiraceae bacterium]
MLRIELCFEESVELYKKDLKRHTTEQNALNEINERIENGKIIEQKSWKFIKELNSYSRDTMNSVALSDGKTDLTYRQLTRTN